LIKHATKRAIVTHDKFLSLREFPTGCFLHPLNFFPDSYGQILTTIFYRKLILISAIRSQDQYKIKKKANKFIQLNATTTISLIKKYAQALCLILKLASAIPNIFKPISPSCPRPRAQQN
jgi:hypothetical protein